MVLQGSVLTVIVWQIAYRDFALPIIYKCKHDCKSIHPLSEIIIITFSVSSSLALIYRYCQNQFPFYPVWYVLMLRVCYVLTTLYSSVRWRNQLEFHSSVQRVDYTPFVQMNAFVYITDYRALEYDGLNMGDRVWIEGLHSIILEVLLQAVWYNLKSVWGRDVFFWLEWRGQVA